MPEIFAVTGVAFWITKIFGRSVTSVCHADFYRK